MDGLGYEDFHPRHLHDMYDKTGPDGHFCLPAYAKTPWDVAGTEPDVMGQPTWAT